MILNRLQANVVLITAQALEYVNKIGASDFPNVVTEKGMTITVAGITKSRDLPPEVAEFITLMQEYLATVEYKFVLNKKTAGYAVGYRSDAMPSDVEQVRGIMRAQQDQTDGRFTIDETDKFLDLTLTDLSKADALTAVKARMLPLTRLYVACGDSPQTDGPMLDRASHGIMVKNRYLDYPCIPDPAHMLAILVWFDHVQTHPNRL